MKKQSKNKPSIRSLALAQQVLGDKIDATRSELNNKIDATRLELNNRFGFLSSEMSHLDNRVAVMEKNMATKEDLKGFATKEDLKGFATKEDLKPFATKEDLKNELKGFVTNEKFDRLVVEVVKNGNDIAQLKEIIPIVFEMRDQMRQQNIHFDAFARDSHRIFDNDRIHDGYLRDHEKRISALESQ